MRFLANENVTATVIRELRQRGHDVLSAKESMRSERDDVILARAQAEQRIVVTHDKDFGELAFWSLLPASCGVILLRLAGPATIHPFFFACARPRAPKSPVVRCVPRVGMLNPSPRPHSGVLQPSIPQLQHRPSTKFPRQ